MKKSKALSLILSIVILSVFAAMIFVPQLFTSYDRKDMFEPWIKPCQQHILGTNALGYDIFTELVYGTGRSIGVGLSSGFLSLAIGLVFGIAAAGKGPAGKIFSGAIDIFVMLPKLICLIVLAAFLGNRSIVLITLIALFSWAPTARSIRTKTRQIYVQPYIENLRIQGFGGLHIALRHVIPGLFNLTLSRFLVCINSCIMMESTLSFLGMGDIYYPTWGTMVNFAYSRGAFIRGAYWYLLAPGICIALLSLSFYLMGSWIENRREEI